MSATATRVLDNYIAGRWTPVQAATEAVARFGQDVLGQ